MYDSEYFRKVIGSNYNPKDLYTNTTYANNEIKESYLVDTPVFSNKEQGINFVNNNDIISSSDEKQQSLNTNNFVSNMNVTDTNSIISNEATYNVNAILNKEAYNTNSNPNELTYNTNISPDRTTYNTNTIPTETVYNTNTVPIETAYNTNTISSEVTYNKTTKYTYPDIYNMLTPMLDTILKEKQNMEYNETTIETMCTEIYNALEVDVNPQKTNESNVLNNVVEVNAKPKNYLLHDLIKIMLINKIENNK